jgi:hypothetical protein
MHEGSRCKQRGKEVWHPKKAPFLGRGNKWKYIYIFFNLMEEYRASVSVIEYGGCKLAMTSQK